MKEIKIIHISLEDAARIGGMLGKMLPTMLQYHGIYVCYLEGVKTAFVLE